MKRRGFLGFLGGAAVAGPAAAKNVISTPALGSGNLASGMALGSYGSLAEAPSRGVFSAFDRISKLKKLISGEETDERDPYDIASRRRIYAEHEVNALHSMSMPAKLRMLSRKMDVIETERKRGYWLLELMNLERGG